MKGDPGAGLPLSWLAPALEARSIPDRRGNGVFARRPVAKGELLLMWGGRVVDLSTLRSLPDTAQIMSLQVEDDLFLISTDQIDPADYINHSCDPNAGLSGTTAVVALRDIEVDEEVCYDYAMTDSSSINPFLCGCGSVRCRGRVGPDDWRLSELWIRYGDAFSPYLLRRIRTIKESTGVSLPVVPAGI